MSVLDGWADPYNYSITIATLLQKQYPDLYKIIAEEYEQHKQFVAQEAARKQREEEERSKLSILKQRGYSPFQKIGLATLFVLALYLSYHLYQRMKPTT